MHMHHPPILLAVSFLTIRYSMPMVGTSPFGNSEIILVYEWN